MGRDMGEARLRTQTYFRLSLVQPPIIFGGTSESRKYVCVRRLERGALEKKKRFFLVLPSSPLGHTTLVSTRLLLRSSDPLRKNRLPADYRTTKWASTNNSRQPWHWNGILWDPQVLIGQAKLFDISAANRNQDGNCIFRPALPLSQ